MDDAKRDEKTLTAETVPTATNKVLHKAKPDVVSDPALSDKTGAEWTDEGGATADGPATANDHD